ncbi:hypothetical protein BN973_03417 [Mycobacterium triplex]|uniref:Acyl-CoA thioesterase-like C-terminal domain-containing protein n=1 Tax=Mycobacterium triplex TaxID=47839 RepID=A0A024JZF0_9MYCO|nr:hypothetical protein BN973_03417 [Mycobacterium triplex]
MGARECEKPPCSACGSPRTNRSTQHWMAELDALDGDYVLACAHANRFTHGHSDQSAQVWSRDGVLLAGTHQIVYFKA